MPFKVKDHFYKKAKKENYLARSVYKLEEINKKFKILKRGSKVLDLGYYPGSWVQYASQIVGEQGLVVGVDLQPVNKELLELKNVQIYQKDINEISSLNDFQITGPFDIVLADLAPKTTGIKLTDQANSLALLEQVFKILPLFLRPNGYVVAKIFDSPEAQLCLRGIKNSFESLKRVRPKSTRSVSKEFFVIGKKFHRTSATH